MDGTTSALRGSGHRPVSSSWADMLVPQKSATIPRAWCRVPVAAGPATLRKGATIMKRVGRSADMRVVRQQQAMAAQGAAQAEVVEEVQEAQRASRRRLNSFMQPAENAMLELVGEPLSRAEMASAIMRAKVDVANCFLHEEYADLSDQRSLAKKSTYSKRVVPLKRRFVDYSSINFEYASGGNGGAIYSELHPILSKAVQTGVKEIDVNMASITEAGVHLRSIRRNPRIPLAASGIPDLSDIADANEPSILTLEPGESMVSDAKSPTKRQPTQSPSPPKNKSFRKRLSDTIVRLLPVSSSRAEPSPSPIKPPSPPPPRKDGSPRQRTPSITIPKSPSAARSSSPVSANSTPGIIRWTKSPKESPFSRWRPKRKSEPIPTLAAPSSPSRDEPDSSFSDITMGDSSILEGSPAHLSRPKAPTPSKWSGLRPSTPSRASPPAAVTASSNDRASLELVKSLPEWMQHSQSPSTVRQYDPAHIDFRPSSPSFSGSVPWVNSPADAIENGRTSIVRRRKSEPLFRNMLKSQNARRKSFSPQKSLRGQETSGILPTVKEPASRSRDFPSQISGHSQASVYFSASSAQCNPLDPEHAEDMDLSDLSRQYKRKMRETCTRLAAPQSEDNIFVEDMHRPDSIFGVPTIETPTAGAVEQLSSLAQNACHGNAGVMVVESDGRLWVRFKLPPRYTHLFPKNQLDGPSSSEKSPSAPDAPVFRFVKEFPRDEESDVQANDETLIVSDFNVSSAQPISSPPLPDNDENVDPRAQANDETLIVSDFDASSVRPTSSSPSREDSSARANDETLIVSDFDVSSAGPSDGSTTVPGYTEPTPAKAAKSVPGSDSSSSLSELERTPDLDKAAESSIASMVAAVHSAAAPTLSSSFTPVNQTSAHASSIDSSNRGTESEAKVRNHDSPERDYLRDFIRRSRPRARRQSTESGSPIAPAQRLPLGARSPNMETQQKEKRKFDSSEGEENEFQSTAEPPTKRVRSAPRSSPRKSTVPANSQSDDEDPLAKDTAAAQAKTVENADAPANAVEPQEAPAAAAAVSRRSTRLRNRPSAIPKSSIPAPVKVGRGRPPTGATLGSVRTEQQDLVHQTRANTRRNKGNAEYPAQFLARRSEEDEGGDGELAAGQQDEAEASTARRGKSVVWKEPLADFQEEEKPKRGRGAAVAARAQPASNRVSKPGPKPSAANQRQRSTRLAAGLGMAGNGTPAPKRATRASTRSRK
ncbi:hypothetical protein BBK36DRAFT_1127524 [Trichoderma citrinoviride]|uniref:Uncharacterized protein n=1 Tax=Trichoderma citrinoviride TaxID=58853 RepID=A0A2T4B1T1_9HYPO|nr:hypothetical protein BBK36DRAFT_1127524 [Trichoderma citrinoviride]PTB63161.1 hypothetical protein BBK36DRAFT_1127524 [Trichoderma citrinoviride]